MTHPEVVVITGASAGVGRAVRKFARRGAHVGLIDRGAEGLEGATREVERALSRRIVGNKIAPRYADLYLARNGYRSQQTKTPEDPAWPDNLWQPVPGDHGAHGDFDQRARRCSAQFWMTTHRNWLAVAGLALGGAAWVALLHQRRSRWHIRGPHWS